MDREQQAAAIVAEARKTRRRPSRGLWIAALAIGAACAIGFAILMLAEPAPATTGPSPPSTGGGFASGLAIGLAIGLAVGLAIARQRSAHSSRNSP